MTGLLVTDDTHLTQIDSNFFGLVRKATVTLSPVAGPAGGGLAITGEPPLIYGGAWAYYDTTPGVWTKYARAAVRLRSDQWVFMDFLVGRLSIYMFPAPPVNATLSILAATASATVLAPPVIDIYDVASPSIGDSGLAIWNAAGQKVFWSGDEQMRVLAWAQGDAPTEVNPTFPWSQRPNPTTYQTHAIQAGAASASLTQDCYGSDPFDDTDPISRSWWRQRSLNSVELAAGSLYSLNASVGVEWRPGYSSLIVKQGL